MGVQKLSKSQKRNDNDIFASAENVDNVGIIRYVGEVLDNRFKVGQKIYFGNQSERIRMGSEDITVMKEDNIYAVVEEEVMTGSEIKDGGTRALTPEDFSLISKLKRG